MDAKVSMTVRAIRLLVPGILVGPLAVGLLVAGDCLAGDVIPISQESKVFLMGGMAFAGVAMLLLALWRMLHYVHWELASVLLLGAASTCFCWFALGWYIVSGPAGLGG